GVGAFGQDEGFAVQVAVDGSFGSFNGSSGSVDAVQNCLQGSQVGGGLFLGNGVVVGNFDLIQQLSFGSGVVRVVGGNQSLSGLEQNQSRIGTGVQLTFDPAGSPSFGSFRSFSRQQVGNGASCELFRGQESRVNGLECRLGSQGQSDAFQGSTSFASTYDGGQVVRTRGCVEQSNDQASQFIASFGRDRRH